MDKADLCWDPMVWGTYPDICIYTTVCADLREGPVSSSSRNNLRIYQTRTIRGTPRQGELDRYHTSFMKRTKRFS